MRYKQKENNSPLLICLSLTPWNIIAPLKELKKLMKLMPLLTEPNRKLAPEA
jgi:hypothetical protein